MSEVERDPGYLEDILEVSATPEWSGTSLVGSVFALLGAAGLAVSAFLPYADEQTTSFAIIVDNTLLEAGTGIELLACAAIIAAATLVAFRRVARKWLDLALLASIYGLVSLIIVLLDEEVRTFYPLDESGDVISNVGETADPGTGVYVGLVSASAAIIGTALLRITRTKRVLARQAADRRPVATPSAQAVPADRLERLERLARLRESATLTDAEFEAEKAKILGADQHASEDAGAR